MTRDLLQAILSDYALDPRDIHGVYHWARVLENGTRIAEATGADTELVQLFSIFHDCRRVNEGTDPGHGRRGANFAATLRGGLVQLEPSRFELLHYACTDHTEGLTEADPTVQACWDADRLDLGRVGIELDPDLLCTDIAKQSELFGWANDRACKNFVSPHAEEWFGWVGEQ